MELLSPITLKNGCVLPNRIFQGPMEGVTEGSYINAMSVRGWVKCWWTPFIRITTGVPRRSKLFGRIKPYLETGLPVIAQIMGTDEELLAASGRRLGELGAQVVDLNCACPSRNVLSSGAGGARLQDPEWICRGLKMLRQALPSNIGLSVKLRIGYESPAEFVRIAKAVNEASPDMVTVHFRTVREVYAPVKDGLKRLAEVRRLLPNVFLVGAGDIFSADDALRMVDETGVDGVAPARGLITNPRLLVDIANKCIGHHICELSVAEKIAFLQDLRIDDSETCRGYVLQSAVQMLGKEHEYVRTLMKGR